MFEHSRKCSDILFSDWFSDWFSEWFSDWFSEHWVMRHTVNIVWLPYDFISLCLFTHPCVTWLRRRLQRILTHSHDECIIILYVFIYFCLIYYISSYYFCLIYYINISSYIINLRQFVYLYWLILFTYLFLNMAQTMIIYCKSVTMCSLQGFCFVYLFICLFIEITFIVDRLK